MSKIDFKQKNKYEPNKDNSVDKINAIRKEKGLPPLTEGHPARILQHKEIKK